MSGSYRLYILISTMLLSFAPFIHAVTITWDDEAMDKDWTNPINWDGNIVPMTLDDVVIPSGFIVNLSNSTSIQSMSLMGTLVIESAAQLDVFIGVPNGVTITGGDLTVEGTLNIILADTHGIEIKSLGSLIIKGNLVIDQVGNTGIFIDFNSTFTAHLGAVVNIKNVASGVNCNFGVVNNQGRIDVSENNGMVGNGVRVGNSGTFNNNIGGRLNISNFTAADLADGIHNRNEFTNLGTIDIDEIRRRGIDNDRGNFQNNGTLTINTTEGTGIYNNTMGVFTNDILGYIKVGGIVTNEFANICMNIRGLSFTNRGTIELVDFGSRGITNMASDGFINTGTINISTENCGQLISNTSSFVNEVEGIVSISVNSIVQVIANFNSFENHGQFSIDVFDSDVIIFSSIANSTTEFINSGTLNIDGGAGGTMQGLKGNSGTTFSNTGIIEMSFDDLQEFGIKVDDGVHFTNGPSGVLNLSYGLGSLGDPFIVDTGGNLYNEGQITVQEF